MKVLHVISGLGRGGGGPSRSCQGLVAAECAAGVDACIWPLKGGKPWIEGVRDIQCRFDDAEELRKTLLGYDLVHIHGLWDLRLHKVAVACRRAGVKYIIAPRGMLEPWSLQQKWLKKRIARFVYQDRDLRLATALHATAESEAEQFRRLGFTNPIIISPNGVNVPNADVGNKQSTLELQLKTRTNADVRRALFVSRMHPKKGVLELVEVWKKISNAEMQRGRDGCGWICELVYTVSGELEHEYEARVKARVKELGVQDQFIFTGALNDDEKWNAYARADLFVLPTYSENFGIVVAEALWAGVPVITTKGTPWHELETCKAGWWIDLPPTASLDRALSEAFSTSPEELAEMGRRGRQLVEEKYTWSAVVRPIIDGYNRAVGK